MPRSIFPCLYRFQWTCGGSSWARTACQSQVFERRADGYACEKMHGRERRSPRHLRGCEENERKMLVVVVRGRRRTLGECESGMMGYDGYKLDDLVKAYEDLRVSLSRARILVGIPVALTLAEHHDSQCPHRHLRVQLPKPHLLQAAQDQSGCCPNSAAVGKPG